MGCTCRLSSKSSSNMDYTYIISKLGVIWDVHIDYLVGNLVNALTLQNYMI